MEVLMSTILVTGATGVVGRRLVPTLVQGGHRVIAMARGSSQRDRLEKVGAATVEANFFDHASLRRAVKGCGAVVNLATHMPSSSKQMIRRSAWRENDDIRREGSSNLVDAALAEGVARFVQESFAPVYPDSGDRWIEEETPLQPVSYNTTIMDAERSAERFTTAGRTGVVLRFAWFYGPDSRFLLEALPQVRHGTPILPGSPDAYFSSVHHDDAAAAAAAALELPAGVYNVVEDEPATHGEYLHSLARALGAPPPKAFPFWMKWLFGTLGQLMSRSLRISNRKLKAASRWTPRYRSVSEAWPSVLAGISGAGSAAA
jgi:nucleoside-diphosphate-sugar epimerase